MLSAQSFSIQKIMLKYNLAEATYQCLYLIQSTQEFEDVLDFL